MKWYYESNGQPQGPILESELRQLRDSGKISGDCLVWREGMEDWEPLDSVRLDEHLPRLETDHTRQGAFPLPSLENLPDAKPGTSADAPPPPPDLQTWAEHGDLQHPQEGAPRAGSHPEDQPEWDHASEPRLAQSFLPSLVRILFEPGAVFRDLKPDGGWGRPLAFLTVGNALGTIFLLASMRHIPPGSGAFAGILRSMIPGKITAGVIFGSILGSTLVLPLTALLKAGVLHFMLKVGAGSRQPFQTTFRALSYALGGTSVLWALAWGALHLTNLAGDPAANEWALMLATSVSTLWSAHIVLRAMSCSHRIPMLRTGLTLLLPPTIALLLLASVLASSSAP